MSANKRGSRAGGWFLAIALALALGACSSSSGNKTAAGQQAVRGGYKIGVPYTIRGVKYYPREDFAYDRTGLASWYGDPFHGRKTANGEIYNKWAMTAAHKTLQMPSLVEVTNLENGRKLILRVNDRGPFVSGRIIDLSRGAARKLGVEKTGVAKVRVRILKKESLRLKELALANAKPATIAAAPRSNVVARNLPPASAGVAGQSGAPTALTAPSLAVQSSARLPAGKPIQVSSRRPAGAGNSAPKSNIVAPPAPRNGSIFIQAGAFRSAGNARRLRDSLANIGPARVVSAEVGGQRYYRVRLGPVATVEQGNRLLARIVGAGYPRARMIVRD
ncbi:MAG: septal ring lytic transglycosylase RlpA family protein [Alphaproteobacteria bacterium]